MKTAAYWAGRMETLNEALLNRGDAYAESMRLEYDKATSRINADVERWYARLAKNNGVSMADARQLLKAGELKEFKWTVEEYIKAGKENAVDQRWMKELENASAKVHISRLEAIQTQMRQHVEVLTAKRLTGTTDTLGGIYRDGYYRSIFELQQGTGIGSSFAKLDKRQLDSVLAKPWAPDGRNFSARIWGDHTKLVNELHTTLTQGLIRGDAPDKMIKQLSERMGVSYKAAARLVLTESAYFAGRARMDGYKELGVEDYKYTATLDSRTSTLCKDMDGKVFKLAEAEPGVNYPPLHAHCRSTTIPHYEDNVKERAARDEDGETYDVPGDMTYREWEKEHAPETTKPVETPVTPLTPDAPQPQPTPVPEFQPAPTIKAAEEAAVRDYGFTEADYSGLDLDSANEVNRAVDKAMRDYPEIKGFAKEIHAVDDDKFVAMATIGQDAGKLYSNLKVSSKYYNSREIDDIIEQAILYKHWPQGSTRSSIFIHEFGHLLEYAHATKVMGSWTDIPLSMDDVQVIFARIQNGTLSKAIMEEALAALGLPNNAAAIKEALSDYANKNTKEFLAEAFAEVVGTANPRPLALKAIEILNRKLKEAGLL